MGRIAQRSEQGTHNALVLGSNPSTPIMDDTKLLSAMEYFLTRKKQIERYIEGEHKWYGDVDEYHIPTMNDSPKPWYMSEGC